MFLGGSAVVFLLRCKCVVPTSVPLPHQALVAIIVFIGALVWFGVEIETSREFDGLVEDECSEAIPKVTKELLRLQTTLVGMRLGQLTRLPAMTNALALAAAKAGRFSCPSACRGGGGGESCKGGMGCCHWCGVPHSPWWTALLNAVRLPWRCPAPFLRGRPHTRGERLSPEGGRRGVGGIEGFGMGIGDPKPQKASGEARPPWQVGLMCPSCAHRVFIMCRVCVHNGDMMGH